jgi:hypothetical protein
VFCILQCSHINKVIISIASLLFKERDTSGRDPCFVIRGLQRTSSGWTLVCGGKAVRITSWPLGDILGLRVDCMNILCSSDLLNLPTHNTAQNLSLKDRHIAIVSIFIISEYFYKE